jgi:sulfur transfer protein SufE
MKKKKRIEKMLSGRKSLNKIISLKSLRSNISKTFNKEKKFRCLLSKGYVYDSLDDEEESDQEDINNCYLEPNSIFLYITNHKASFLNAANSFIFNPEGFYKVIRNSAICRNFSI